MRGVDSSHRGPGVVLRGVRGRVRESPVFAEPHRGRGRTVAEAGQACFPGLEVPGQVGRRGSHRPRGPCKAGHTLPGAAGEAGQDILSLSSSGNPYSGRPPGEQPFLCAPGLPRLLGSGSRTLPPACWGFLPSPSAPPPPEFPDPWCPHLHRGAASHLAEGLGVLVSLLVGLSGARQVGEMPRWRREQGCHSNLWPLGWAPSSLVDPQGSLSFP